MTGGSDASGKPALPVVIAVITLLTVIWGTTWAAIRVGLRSIPPFTGVSLRFGIAALALFLLARLRGIPLGTSSRERWLWLVIAATSFSGSYGVVYWSEQWVPSGLAAVLFATFPLFAAILAQALLPAERLTWRGGIGVLIGFAGVGVIFSEDLGLLGGPQVARASIIMLLSPLASAIGSTAVKRWGYGINPVSLAAGPMGLTALIMGVVALATEAESPIHFDLPATGSLIYLALFGTALTFTLYWWLLAYLPATSLALISYLIPVVAVAVGAAFMDETFTMRTLAGSLLVLLGVGLAASKRRASRSSGEADGSG